MYYMALGNVDGMVRWWRSAGSSPRPPACRAATPGLWLWYPGVAGQGQGPGARSHRDMNQRPWVRDHGDIDQGPGAMGLGQGTMGLGPGTMDQGPETLPFRFLTPFLHLGCLPYIRQY